MFLENNAQRMNDTGLWDDFCNVLFFSLVLCVDVLFVFFYPRHPVVGGNIALVVVSHKTSKEKK